MSDKFEEWWKDSKFPQSAIKPFMQVAYDAGYNARGKVDAEIDCKIGDYDDSYTRGWNEAITWYKDHIREEDV